jgi:hypothetical protein
MSDAAGVFGLVVASLGHRHLLQPAGDVRWAEANLTTARVSSQRLKFSIKLSSSQVLKIILRTWIFPGDT